MDYMKVSLYRMDSEENWSIGCPTGDAIPVSTQKAGSSISGRGATRTPKSFFSDNASSISRISSIKGNRS